VCRGAGQSDVAAALRVQGITGTWSAALRDGFSDLRSRRRRLSGSTGARGQTAEAVLGRRRFELEVSHADSAYRVAAVPFDVHQAATRTTEVGLQYAADAGSGRVTRITPAGRVVTAIIL
jgi:hypothetical protein